MEVRHDVVCDLGKEKRVSAEDLKDSVSRRTTYTESADLQL